MNLIEPEGLSIEELRARLSDLRELSEQVRTEEEAREVASRIAQITRRYRIATGKGIARSPLMQAKELDPRYRERPHLAYLSSRLVQAVRDVERGQNRHIIVSMPPRSGKSTMTSKYFPLWLLRRHPEWSVVMVSYDAALSSGWAGNIREFLEDKPALGVALARDAGARGRWETVEGGGMYATSVGGALTGRGARVMVIDDPISDFAAAHSPRVRAALWNWWLSVARTRLEPPYLVLVTMTRWHEDDFAGRLLSMEYEGDPREWEQVRLPAFAEADDVLQREEGMPLISPLMDENPAAALARWEATKISVGSYTFASMYQQRPAPQKGAIFDVGWWRYWTRDPGKATEDGRIVYFNPDDVGSSGRWLDSWDCAFKGGVDSSSYVVGQRWVRHKANRYLVAQVRGRWAFTQTIKKMKAWVEPTSPFGQYVHQRLIEDKANGPAIIDTLREEVAGIKPINPGNSKEGRARAITPEIESGNVYLPHPSDDGNEWVTDLLSELRNFPHDTYDDQVDALTQALSELRDTGRGSVTVPRRTGPATYVKRDIAAAARSQLNRSGFHRR